jgi:hypothetical protein
MRPHDLFHNTKEWQRKVALISYLHNKMIYKTKGKWTLKDTAKYYEISVGLVSENLKLAEFMDKIKVCKNRKQALTILRINGY